jgi:Resolvase, N terminal domain
MLRRGQAVDGGRVRGPGRQRVEGQAARPRYAAPGRETTEVRCAGVLAIGPARAQPAPPDVTIDELTALGIGFVSLGEGIDTSTPAGRLQLHVLAAIAEFERARLRERVSAGLARAKAQGVRLGRPRRYIDPERLASVAGPPEREAARRLGVPRSTLQRLLSQQKETQPLTSV